MRSDIVLLHVRGIPIGVSWSWVLIFVFLTWALGSAFFPLTYPGLTGTEYLVMALVTAVLFFGSVLLHELGHALVGAREGVEIEGITLWLFGGVARFKGRTPSPGAELRMTAVGPAISIALALAFWTGAVAAGRLDASEPVTAVVGYLARINAILAAFNLVPALPLDGGRILHSWLWRRLGDHEAATVSAAAAGRAFGYVLITVGLLGFLTGYGLGGLWFVFIGWFLAQAASAEAAAATTQRALHGRRVGDLMTPEPAVVDPWMTLDRFLDEASGPRGHSTYPVVDGDRLVGLVSVRMAGRVPADERPATRVTDVMLADDAVPTLAPDDPLTDVLDRGDETVGRFVVVDHDRVVGLLSRSDLVRVLEVAQARGPLEVAREPGARRAGIGVWVVVGLIITLAAGFLYRPPLAVVSSAEAIDLTDDVTISGVATTPVAGRILATPVRAEQTTALGTVVAFFDPDREVVPVSAIVPEGADPARADREREAQLRESQLLAAAAAAATAGLDVRVDGSGAQILRVIEGAPAERALEAGDVVVGVDGQPVRLAADLRDIVGARPAGTSFALAIERIGQRIEVTIESTRLQRGLEEVTGIGVIAETRGLVVDLPFEVTFRDRPVGGPSAGLAYALLIADLLAPEDLLDGRTIAATGTVDLEGNVGPVGGLPGKVISARDAGAEVFLVPLGDEVGAGGDDGVRIVPVGTLGEALERVGGTLAA